jgi:hypothetical protein
VCQLHGLIRVSRQNPEPPSTHPCVGRRRMFLCVCVEGGVPVWIASACASWWVHTCMCAWAVQHMYTLFHQSCTATFTITHSLPLYVHPAILFDRSPSWTRSCRPPAAAAKVARHPRSPPVPGSVRRMFQPRYWRLLLGCRIWWMMCLRLLNLWLNSLDTSWPR